jgi:hypothetical protein
MLEIKLLRNFMRRGFAAGVASHKCLVISTERERSCNFQKTRFLTSFEMTSLQARVVNPIREATMFIAAQVERAIKMIRNV